MATTTSAQQILRSAAVNFPPEYWELIERYRGELMNQAVAILGNAEDAEDVVQETFCEAFRNAKTLAKADSIGAWMRTINRMNALSHGRNKRRDSRRIDRKQWDAPQKTVTSGGFKAFGLCESVAKAIETLPDEMRAVVVLRYWEHLSYEEIAQRLSLPVGTVGRLRYEASIALHGKLKTYFEQP